MENNALCKITVIEMIIIKMFDGTTRIFSDMKHVPNLKRNFISLSTLDSKGDKYTIENRVLKVSKYTCVVMKRTEKVSQLYVLQGSTISIDTN